MAAYTLVEGAEKGILRQSTAGRFSMTDDQSADVDDEALAIRMMDGDQSALRQVLELHGGMVKGWLVEHFPSLLQSQEIDEAFNVAVFNVWEKEHGAKHIEYDPAYDPAGDCPEPSEELPPDKQTRKRLKDLNEVIDALPTLQKAVINADLAAGGRAEAGRLAEIHGTSKNSVYVSRTKAHEAIKKAMLQRGHYPENKKGNP